MLNETEHVIFFPRRGLIREYEYEDSTEREMVTPEILVYISIDLCLH